MQGIFTAFERTYLLSARALLYSSCSSSSPRFSLLLPSLLISRRTYRLFLPRPSVISAAAQQRPNSGVAEPGPWREILGTILYPNIHLQILLALFVSPLVIITIMYALHLCATCDHHIDYVTRKSGVIPTVRYVKLNCNLTNLTTFPEGQASSIVHVEVLLLLSLTIDLHFHRCYRGQSGVSK